MQLNSFKVNKFQGISAGGTTVAP